LLDGYEANARCYISIALPRDFATAVEAVKLAFFRSEEVPAPASCDWSSIIFLVAVEYIVDEKFPGRWSYT
jgi:hypothetical protein